MNSQHCIYLFEKHSFVFEKTEAYKNYIENEKSYIL